MNIITETEKAYIAGFMDGEGCISIGKYQGKHNRTPVYQLQLVISQKVDVLRDLCRIAGVGSVCLNNHKEGRKYQQWRMSPHDAVDFLKAILPYLRVKRQEAEIAIEFQEKQGNKNFVGLGYTTPQHLIDEKESYYQALRSLKGDSAKGRRK